jgi:hypothetical protein
MTNPNTPEVRFVLTDWDGATSEAATWTLYDEGGSVMGSAFGWDAGALWNVGVAYALPNGLVYRSIGRTYRVSNGQVPFLCSRETLDVPPTGGGLVLIDNVISLIAPTDGGPGLRFDAMELFGFYWRWGEMLYRGHACPVLIHPRGNTPHIDHNNSFNSNDIFLCSITDQDIPGEDPANPVTPRSAAVIGFDASAASIAGNQFRFCQVAGPHADNGMIVWPGNNENAEFRNNLITFSYIASLKGEGAGIAIGQGQANQSRMKRNRWVGGAITPDNPNVDGVRSYGSFDHFDVGHIGSDTGTGIANGIVFGAGSDGNRYRIGQINGFSGADVINSGGAGNRAI